METGIFSTNSNGIRSNYIIIYVCECKKLRELRQSGIYDIDKMSGHQFEKYLGSLFPALGYKTEITKASNDFGADLILRKMIEELLYRQNAIRITLGLNLFRRLLVQKNFIKLMKHGLLQIVNLQPQHINLLK